MKIKNDFGLCRVADPRSGERGYKAPVACFIAVFLVFNVNLLRAGSADQFPIGMYGLTMACTNDFPILKDAGFNCVQSYRGFEPLDGFMKECERHGFKLLISPGTSAGPSFNENTMKNFVARTGTSAPLLGWYMIDEPDFQKIAPTDVERCRNALKSTGTKFPSVIVLSDGKSAGFYASTADILMVDWYPIPHLPLASFGTAVRQGRFAAGPDKPVWGVVQAFDWVSLFPRAGRLNASRFPSRQEMRALALLGVVEGASGLFFFVHQDGERLEPITQRGEDWNRLKPVVQELARQAPVLGSPTIWSPVKQHIEKDKLRWRNVLGDEALQAARKRLKEDREGFVAGDYLLVVNTTSEQRASQIWVPGLKDGEVKVDGKDEPATIHNGWIMDDFEPYATRIYGPLPLRE